MTSPADTIRAALTSMRAAAWGREAADLALAALTELEQQLAATREWHPLYEAVLQKLITAEADRDRLAALLEPLAVCQVGGDMEGDPNCCAGCAARAALATPDTPPEDEPSDERHGELAIEDESLTPPAHRMAADSSHCRYCGCHVSLWSTYPCATPDTPPDA